MPGFDLYLITDPAPGESPIGPVARALAGVGPRGARVAVQLRARELCSRELITTGHALRRLTREAGSALLINDRADVAQLCEADGIQLPEHGMTIADARACLGTRTLIGVSRHDGKGLAQAAAMGADFATLSPVHAVAGKGPALGSAGFARLTRDARLPVYALGGVTLHDVDPLRAAGARGVAVIRAVFAHNDPARATSALLDRLSRGRS